MSQYLYLLVWMIPLPLLTYLYYRKQLKYQMSEYRKLQYRNLSAERNLDFARRALFECQKELETVLAKAEQFEFLNSMQSEMVRALESQLE
jgi:hypothetical protein